MKITENHLKLPGTLSVIGGGRMGESIIKGLLAASAVEPESVLVAELLDQRCEELTRTYGVACTDSVADSAARGDIVLIAVKPQVIGPVVEQIAPSLGDALVISIAAGITSSTLEGLLPNGARVVRVMPNTPAMVGEGMSVLSGGSAATDEDLELALGLFSLLGDAVVLDEVYQDAATGISGSGPAYAALFVDALARGGEAQGLTREVAERLAIQTLRGTADLLAESGMTPSELIQGVSSPGGTTVAALGVLEEGGFADNIISAVAAAAARAKELGS